MSQTSYPFILSCQSDQKPPREWGNQVGGSWLIQQISAYLPGAKNKKQATQTFSSAHSQEERVVAEKENLSTHWLYIIFISKKSFHPMTYSYFCSTVSACFPVLTSACEESSNWNSEQKSESRLYILICLWLVSDEVDKLLTAVVPLHPLSLSPASQTARERTSLI